MKQNPSRLGDSADLRGGDSLGGDFQLDAFLPYRLSVLSNRVSGAIARLYEERFGLGIAEWRITAVLGGFGSMSATAVGDRTAMDKVQVSRTLQRLIEKGLVARQIDAGDRRRHVLELTSAGRAIYREIVPLALSLEARLLDGLNGPDRAAIEQMLDRLTQAVDRLEISAP
jgi:DNA-binding MarR family transcriptional regulator